MIYIPFVPLCFYGLVIIREFSLQKLDFASLLAFPSTKMIPIDLRHLLLLAFLRLLAYSGVIERTGTAEATVRQLASLLVSVVIAAFARTCYYEQ